MQPKSLFQRTRNTAINLFYDTGFSHLFYQLRGRKRGMITYHNVLAEKHLPQGNRFSQDVTLEVMDFHLHFLSKHFGILPYSELNKPTSHGFLISFDDGMLNNYTVLLPLLEKYKVQAMFAICPDGVSRRIPFIWRDHLFLILKQLVGKEVFLPINRYQFTYQVTSVNIDSICALIKEWVYENRVTNLYGMVQEICTRNGLDYHENLNHDPSRFNFMNWDMIKDLHQRGHIIASHTLSHRVLRFLSPEEKWSELKYSKEEIEDHLHAPVNSIVYPYGGEKEVDVETIQIAKQAGYIHGFLNVQHPLYEENGLTMPRFGLPRNQSQPHLHATVSGLTSFFSRKAV